MPERSAGMRKAVRRLHARAFGLGMPDRRHGGGPLQSRRTALMRIDHGRAEPLTPRTVMRTDR